MRNGLKASDAFIGRVSSAVSRLYRSTIARQPGVGWWRGLQLQLQFGCNLFVRSALCLSVFAVAKWLPVGIPSFRRYEGGTIPNENRIKAGTQPSYQTGGRPSNWYLILQIAGNPASFPWPSGFHESRLPQRCFSREW